MLDVAVSPGLPDVLIVKPRVHRDARGFFVERWSARTFAELELPTFVQDNHSRSRHGTLRGLHFQTPPHAQGKLVTVVRGTVFDVSVDLRPRSPTFGRWAGNTLDGDEPAWAWVPPGFAHGFLVLSDEADVLYKVTAAYAPASEGGLIWDDPDVAITWPLASGQAPLLSAKDSGWPRFAELSSPF
jgi:dTDP-4-dehydrorhamnose 3,5-epimerase